MVRVMVLTNISDHGNGDNNSDGNGNGSRVIIHNHIVVNNGSNGNDDNLL